MKKVLLFLLACLLLFPKLASADGGLLPPDDYYIFETDQKAAIMYDKGQEDLVISTSFQGDAKDFSWIVPTPSIPEVSKISTDFFENLETLTTQDVGYPKTYIQTDAYGLGAPEEAVEVIEEKQLGYYDVVVLKSNDENALYTWLKENGYTYPDEGKYILDDYISRDWIFTAIKIQSQAVNDEDIQQNLKMGNISPVKFSFKTDKIVYPMYISSIAKYYSEKNKLDYYNGMGVQLYVFADSKMDYTNFNTEYANWVKAKDIKLLGTDENGNDWYDAQNKFYLTKLYRYFEYKDMQEDLYLKKAKDNDKVGVAPWYMSFYNWIVENVFVVAILLLLGFFLPMFWQFKKTSNLCETISWIVQIISFVVLALPAILIMLMALNFGGLEYIFQDKETIIILLYLKLPVIAMLAILIAQKVVQKKYIK